MVQVAFLSNIVCEQGSTNSKSTFILCVNYYIRKLNKLFNKLYIMLAIASNEYD